MLSRSGGLGRRPLLLNSPAHRSPQKSCAKKKKSELGHQNKGKTHPSHSQCTQASHCSSLIMSIYYRMLQVFDMLSDLAGASP